VKIAPNPFNAATSLLFTVGVEADVSARVFDVRGRLVRDLQPGRLGAGPHRLEWDGRDDRGAAAAAGVYLVRVVAGGGEPGVARLVLVK
jgi:flagellar hook assembly protein FlgD